jgi:hypothetical protein
VAVKEEGDHIVFLRSLVAGGADRSYGVEVARLAGLPREVIARARALLRELEGGRGACGPDARRRGGSAAPQLALFAAAAAPGARPAAKVGPNHLTPLQALNLLAELAARRARADLSQRRRLDARILVFRPPLLAGLAAALHARSRAGDAAAQLPARPSTTRRSSGTRASRARPCCASS